MQRPGARRAKIVATLGPATDGRERDLVAAGLDVARLNFSHGTHADHARRAAAIRAAAAEVGRTVALMQDVQGPKIRVGRIPGGPVDLAIGAELRITTRVIDGDLACVSCTYPGLIEDVAPGDRLYLDDGRIRLRVLEKGTDDLRTLVEEGGPLSSNKGINLPGVRVSAPSLTEKDLADLRFGALEIGVDLVALSFVRTVEDVHVCRAHLAALGSDALIVAKLEKSEAIDLLEGILHAADAVMVARGDLGVETAPEMVPMLQKRIVRRANALGVPVITATQMLESMVDDETPTRAEAADVANAVWDGSDALMLSAETAAGRYPIEAVAMMDRIVCAAEAAAEPRAATAGASDAELREAGEIAAVAGAARVLAEEIGARAIAAYTRTGRTARLLSHARSRAPIYAFSQDARVCRRLALWWGVTPLEAPLPSSLEDGIGRMAERLCALGAAGPGDAVVVVGAHPMVEAVHTNFVKVHRV